ncbi:MAG: stage III sporulation protein D [Ruminococcaceae bacterium]|nr:stage III sporulation protein D [Oscillospiraceae bacterium]MBQ6873311.1 sporulation transcriptional regulator SpoIIID [Clostridia bacterium]
MYDNADERAIILAEYIIKNKCTVRDAAAWSGVSKSTVHTDVTARLKGIDKCLFTDVRKVLDENKSERHMRGGLATRELWKNRKS